MYSRGDKDMVLAVKNLVKGKTPTVISIIQGLKIMMLIKCGSWHIGVCFCQMSSVQSLSCVPTLCDPMNHSTPGLPVHHQLLEFAQTHVRRVGDVIQPSHPLSSPSPPAPNPSQHQSLFQ